MKQKRVVTKVGDVFRTKLTSKGYRYVQLVAIDRANMNSDVLVVFVDQGNTDSSLNLEKIVQSPIEFYTHSTASQGVKEKLWEKIGKASVKVNLPELAFKYYRDQNHVNLTGKFSETIAKPEHRPPFSEPYWDVWSLPEDRYHSVSYDEGKNIRGENGGISPASWVIDRIDSGGKSHEIFLEKSGFGKR